MLRVLVLTAVAVLCAGCAGTEASVESAAATTVRPCGAAGAGWQALANRIDAPVYCPSWLPDPLTSTIDGQWNNIRSVDGDRSYLMGFTWYERQSGEVHVNLRGYPGRTATPTCTDTHTAAGKSTRRRVPCFSDLQGTKTVAGRAVAVYTANRGADQWHVLYAWRRADSLYTLSEHVAEPLTYGQVVANLDRMLRSLVLIRPTA